VQREAWFRRLLDRRGTLLTVPAAHTLLDDLDAYCRDLLLWGANMAFGDATDRTSLRLYDVGQFARNLQEGPDRAKLREDAIDSTAFGHLIEDEEAPDLPLVFDRLTYGGLGAGRPGIGRFAQALHHACFS
jgi:hypothetical protein